MPHVTLTVLEGLERGRVFSRLQTPVTIGREDDNDVQLNDERISRVHAKIQTNRDQVVLTDLNSTNGSRVNGYPIQLRILRPGDLIQLGRCILLFGSDSEISQRAADLGISVESLLHQTSASAEVLVNPDQVLADFSIAEDVEVLPPSAPLFAGERPQLPSGLTGDQKAAFSDLLMWFHERFVHAAALGRESEDAREDLPQGTILPWPVWQNLIRLQADFSDYLRHLGDPEQVEDES